MAATNADRATLHWEGNDGLIVQVCGATAYDVKARHSREPAFKHDGTENAIRVEAVAMTAVRNGRQLCHASDAEQAAS
ncbi:hypothetical protein [Sphingomonas spermidinifaciens]|uniref:hypothetical protein n=1 Tax=Sphingomonas spermidinifaciens TaxID=1141889 RepID=UPI001143FF30|nr:hypothetical protein [Sphingomonas spermidinifaciens]